MRWLVVATMLAFALAGCAAPAYVCIDLTDERCSAGAEAAMDVLPPGYKTLTVGQGVGFQSNPAPVLACYPDGSALVLEVIFEGSTVTTRPISGEDTRLDDLCGD